MYQAFFFLFSFFFFFSFFALAQVSFPNSAHAWTLKYLELNSRGEIKEISLK